MSENKNREVIFESDHLDASWARGSKVFVTIIKENGKYSAHGELEDPSVFDTPEEQKRLNKIMYGTDTVPEGGEISVWSCMAPTVHKFSDQIKAEKFAEEMLACREYWLSDKYN